MWTILESDKLYQVSRWGKGHYGINSKGHMCVFPEKASEGPSIDIAEVLDELKAHNIALPAVIRFQDILRSRVMELNKKFDRSIKENDYKGRYMGVFPVKVNQMREVVEEIVDAGEEYSYGLEAGSKPELLSVLSQDVPSDALIVLNGYKDEDYLRLSMIGSKMGRNIVVVVEKFSELTNLIKLSQEYNICPIIGLRAKLASKSSGKWKESSGDKAKFGLTSSEIIQAVQLLKYSKLLDRLQLFHFHIGSQIPDIKTLKNAITEGARYYTNLHKMGAPIKYFDVGGGLGVDYAGTKSSDSSSVNYGLQTYSNDVVYILKQICDIENIPHPNIVSESGRAITAHHSCIITNVFGEISPINDQLNVDLNEEEMSEHIILKNMKDIYADLNAENIRELYYDSIQYKEEALNAFKLGVLSLEQRALVDLYYSKLIKKIASYELSQFDEAPKEIAMAKSQLTKQYLCNFSVFQSAPDSWAIKQVLPIVPIKRLNEEPTECATIADITCDSDGKITQFLENDKSTCKLKLHKLKNDEEYHIGIFLTGAYQDIMGDNHNLFGRLNEVHIFCDDDDPSDFYIEEFIPGNSCGRILKTLQYNPESMAMYVKKQLDKQVRKGKLRPREGVKLTDFYEKSLKDYTYLK